MEANNSLPEKITHRSISELIPYAKNARTHSDEQVAQIAASIREFGFTNPVLLDGDSGIIAGHGRVAAARKLGMDVVPCIDLAYLTDTQRRAYILADNKLAMNAGWDTDMLGLELGELNGEGFDLSLIGFSDLELQGLLVDRTEGLTDPDEAPEPPADPVTVAGDMWACGKHRVLCGDSTVATDVETLLAGVVPLLMVTDPPYGVKYDPKQRRRIDNVPTKRTYMDSGKDTELSYSAAWALFPGNVVYVWHSDKQIIDMGVSLKKCGFDLRQQIIWAKETLTITRTQYKYQHEHCWYAVKNNANWHGPNNSTTLWQIKKVNAETNHGAQKPVECMRRPIVNNSAPGQPVYDPFLGSGTTMIAAEMEDRQCLGLEIAPEYVDVIVKRWQDFTGEQATLLSHEESLDGKTFAEIEEERHGEAR